METKRGPNPKCTAYSQRKKCFPNYKPKESEQVFEICKDSLRTCRGPNRKKKRNLTPSTNPKHGLYIYIHTKHVCVCVVQTAGTTCGGRTEPCVGRVPVKKFCQSLSVPSCPHPASTFHPLPGSTVKGFFSRSRRPFTSSGPQSPSAKK